MNKYLLLIPFLIGCQNTDNYLTEHIKTSARCLCDGDGRELYWVSRSEKDMFEYQCKTFKNEENEIIGHMRIDVFVEDCDYNHD